MSPKTRPTKANESVSSSVGIINSTRITARPNRPRFGCVLALLSSPGTAPTASRSAYPLPPLTSISLVRKKSPSPGGISPSSHGTRRRRRPSRPRAGSHRAARLHSRQTLAAFLRRFDPMDSLPITAEAIAFTEKKMDMTLEDIIKMSKKKNPGGKKPPRQPIKKRPFQNGNSNQGNAKVQRFMESRSSIRQGVLAQRRSNLGGNQFAATKQAAKKAASMPVRNNRWNKPSASTLVQRRPVGDAFQNGKGKEGQNQTPRTMDALFAQMKAQRMKSTPQQQANPAPGRQFQQQRRGQQQQPRRGRGYGGRNVGNQ
ncbi:hypothetical protein EJB05_49550, partial [Eragrostis curvula]